MLCDREFLMMASRDGHSKTKALIKQFCSVTGADKSAAKKMLEVCNYNVEVAINMHVESTEVEAESTSTKKTTASALNEDAIKEAGEYDSVRAPIAPIQGVLVEAGYTSGFRTRRPPRSVFDGFRDFEAETRQQEQELSNSSSNASSKKRKTLEDLFRPPLEMMHKGTFDTARDLGQNTNRWLIVNIQNVQEFPCQVLNRDVWSNQAVKSIVIEHFVFWQVYHDSEEGERYMQFYKIKEWPYIAIIDPRTGENVVTWNKLDSVSFCDLVTEFLTVHPSLDGSSPVVPFVKKQRLESNSILDASEDSQLQAAIRASLLETKARDEPDSSCQKTLDVNYKDSNEHVELNEISNTSLNDNTDGDNDEEMDELETFESDSESSQQMHTLEEIPRAEIRGDNVEDVSKSTPHIVAKWEDFLGLSDDPKSSLVIRFPDGSKEQLNVPCSSKLMALVTFVQAKGYSQDKFELVTNFPRRQISEMDLKHSLKDVGLFPQETVFVQSR